MDFWHLKVFNVYFEVSVGTNESTFQKAEIGSIKNYVVILKKPSWGDATAVAAINAQKQAAIKDLLALRDKFVAFANAEMFQQKILTLKWSQRH